MRRLAAERLNYMLKMFGREKITILVKVGLEVDEEFKEDGNSFEHIWFDLREKSGDDVSVRADYGLDYLYA